MSARTPFPAALRVAALLALVACSDPVEPRLRPPLAELPDDLAAITFTATGILSAPYVMLELRHDAGFSGFVAVRGDGRPVWFHRTQGSPFSFTRRQNGNFVLLDHVRGLIELTPHGTIVSELAQEDRPGRRMHHDVTTTPDNRILFIAEEWLDYGGELLNGEALWEWVPETGETTRRWSARDWLDPAVDVGPRSRADDWLHANAVSFGPRGNVLLSLHFLDQVLSIAPGFAGIEWRLGGIGATIAVDDPFSGQHTAQEVAAGRVLLFDNGFDRFANPHSRAVEYALGPVSATKVWEWRPAQDNWARVISGVRRLRNGNTLATFGTPAGMPPGSTGPIEVYEVAPDGAVRWHLEISGAVSSLYRATPLDGF